MFVRKLKMHAGKKVNTVWLKLKLYKIISYWYSCNIVMAVCKCLVHVFHFFLTKLEVRYWYIKRRMSSNYDSTIIIIINFC